MYEKATRTLDRSYTWLLIVGAVFFVTLLHMMFTLEFRQAYYIKEGLGGNPIQYTDTSQYWKIGFAAFCGLIALICCIFEFLRRFVYTFVVGLAVFDFFVAMCPPIVFSRTVGVLVAIMAGVLALIKYYADTDRTVFAYMGSDEDELANNFYLRVFTALLVMCVLTGYILAITGTYREFIRAPAATSPIGWVIFGVAAAAFFGCMIPQMARYIYSFSLGVVLGVFIPAAINQTAAFIPVYAVIGTAVGVVTATLYSYWRPQEEEYSIIKLLKNPRRLLYDPKGITHYERTPPLPEGVRTYRADDDHEVRSKAELKIDNWLCEHGIEHVYEPQIPGTQYYADFYLKDYDVYIEYWGLLNSGDIDYERRARKKIKQYHKHKLTFIGLFEEDMEKLDAVMNERLKLGER